MGIICKKCGESQFWCQFPLDTQPIECLSEGEYAFKVIILNDECFNCKHNRLHTRYEEIEASFEPYTGPSKADLYTEGNKRA